MRCAKGSALSMRKALLIAAVTVTGIALAGCMQQQREADTLWRDTAIGGGSG